MRILVISDTHGNYPLAIKACDQAAPFDTIIHLGDGDEDVMVITRLYNQQVINVAGNCDLGSVAPRELLWECEGKRLLLTHGDLYGVKRGLGQLEKRGLDSSAQIILYGHTHHADITERSGIILVNPGALSQTSAQPTYAILEITPADISIQIHLI